MRWQKLCKFAEIPLGSAAMFTVGGCDVLFLRTKDGYLALPPPCRHMREPLTEGCFEKCLDNGIPACNRHRNEAGALEGVASAPSLRSYATRVQDGTVYIDLDRENPLEGYQHVTCSPGMTGMGANGLVINFWKEGDENKKETFHIGVTPNWP
ncbi:Rieske (2Fe-2S) protein [Pelomicrobium methylotrophicum]|uniref:Rieske 2Fe-2S domain-containing protein n=1 Tax=Pelomicrobium methylotrophicum TaxID=2602750 RepID=A0A5C7ESQ8_9PROT|nr:Rieske 2Fe-2S domain-containing protein [Pelomicrobium methylotrophicum]TXF09811.1 Rieske 2Fe-2S domain-containing protein [Pelomicrobium methylotrophicum]